MRGASDCSVDVGEARSAETSWASSEPSTCAAMARGAGCVTVIFDDVTFKPRCPVPIVLESQKLVIAKARARHTPRAVVGWWPRVLRRRVDAEGGVLGGMVGGDTRWRHVVTTRGDDTW